MTDKLGTGRGAVFSVPLSLSGLGEFSWDPQRSEPQKIWKKTLLRQVKATSAFRSLVPFMTFGCFILHVKNESSVPVGLPFSFLLSLT